MPKRELPQVDLILLKKLVGELEAAVNATQSLPLVEKEEVNNFIIELAKASGLAAGVAQEASALCKDMYQISKMAQNPIAGMSEDDLMSKIFGESSSVIFDGNKKNRN